MPSLLRGRVRGERPQRESGEDVLAFVPWPEELEARLAGHPVAQRSNAVARDREVRHAEEGDVGERRAGQLLDHPAGARALQLVAVQPRRSRPARRVLVAFDFHVVGAGLGLELHPVEHRRGADEVEQPFPEVKEDGIADKEPIPVHGDVLLHHPGHKALERVDAEVGKESQRIRSLDEYVGHVMRLVEQRTGLAPGSLLRAPVRELGRNRELERREGRVPHQLDGAPGTRDRGLEALGSRRHHGLLFREHPLRNGERTVRRRDDVADTRRSPGR